MTFGSPIGLAWMWHIFRYDPTKASSEEWTKLDAELNAPRYGSEGTQYMSAMWADDMDLCP